MKRHTSSGRSSLVRLRPRSETLYVSQGRAVMATERDGFIRGGADHGLFVHETRLLSRYGYLVNGEAPQPVAHSNVEQHTWLGYYIALPPGVERERDTGSGQMESVTQQTLELRLSRRVADGLHEDVDLTNFTQKRITFTLALEVDADFADVDETKWGREQQGELLREWREAGGGAWELRFDYRVERAYDNQEGKGTASLRRGLALRVENAASPPAYADGRVSFEVSLDPLGRWHACHTLIPFKDGRRLAPPSGCRPFAGPRDEFDRRRQIFLDEATCFTAPREGTLTHVVAGALGQAKSDLAALRLYDLDAGERAWTMSAGLPIYVALFGRDALTAAWEAALLGPEMMKGTLPELARRQGRVSNDWRDEQPGKMLHEAHTGPLKVLNLTPRGRYYGSITTSGFYPVVVSELWHWTGDRELIRPLVRPALDALNWLDRYGDPDGDGFYEYLSRSAQGTKHQGWKDSPDYRRVTEVTYLGYVYGTLAALKRMLPRDRGVVVQVGSALAYRGIPLQSAYCAAKHAVQGFHDSLRSELIHDKSNVQVTMVQLPAMNTPQFSWVKSRLPRKPQPVPPIYQPEVGARAVLFAARNPRREMYVGYPTVEAIVGDKLAPGFADWYLARSGYDAQQTEEPVEPDRRDNLWEPLPGDRGARGQFDERSSEASPQLWATMNRNWLAAAGAGLAGLAAGLLLKRDPATRQPPGTARRLLKSDAVRKLRK